MIVVVDYGAGNLASVLQALQRLGADAILSSRGADVARADRIILPGVGSFDCAMGNIRKRALLPPLTRKVVEQKAPVLGICLGMQLFTERSTEGSEAGLGWIRAETKRFDPPVEHNNLKVPQLGWNEVHWSRDSSLLRNLPAPSTFYFAHSYCITHCDKRTILGTTVYGQEFVSALQQRNIIGTQFHPEKSHVEGLTFLKNFLGMS